jgi:protein TonB
VRVAVLSSLGVHAALLLGAWRAGVSARNDPRANVPIEVSVEPSVTPPEPERVPPPPEPARLPALARRASAPSPRPSALPPLPSPSSGDTSSDPAPGPSAPVDLTGETLVLASTRSSGGGAGDSHGSGARAGDGIGAALGTAPPAGSGTGDRSGAVSLDEHSWACPWPHEADTQQIDEQTVVIKVIVAPDGRVESATVVSDPGHGFGEAAVACALHTRFTPARDPAGRAIRAESPPVLVRFTR